MKNCITLSCPFISYCRFYDFLVDRGDKCAFQTAIVQGAKKLIKEEKKS